MPNNTAQSEIRPWAALWSLVLGFFMILVDSTIVSVANPTIMRALDTDMTAVLWATSAYLLAYAVPLLITGRLGDRFGPRRLYLIGLTVFALSSLACGLAPNIGVLIVARVFQGFGAATMTPQTMTVITRIFAPRERGQAMAIWGVTAGVATLVGPILGGFLIDAVGWEWIFFVNVPIAVVGFVLALVYVPKLEVHSHRLDWLGVALSAVGMFLVVFALQEGENFQWGQVWGPVDVWMLIVVGVAVLVAFVLWQRNQRGEPLMPLRVFRDRNFSVGSAAVMVAGLTSTSMALPLMFYFQLVRGLTPTQSALMLVPMAVLSAVLARPVGKLIDRGDPRRISTAGMLLMAVGLGLYALWMTPDATVLQLLIPSVVLGIANPLMWGPMSAITTFNLTRDLAGAGSGVYNTSRQVGAVFGAASITVFMASRLATQFGSDGSSNSFVGGSERLPVALRSGFSVAMAEAMLLPAVIALLGVSLTLLFARRPPRTGTVKVVAAD